ncbi:MAG: glycogen debranching protein GlgX [Rhodobacteraceae bacterium]|nr:glycogen debranching protein GlgX [Paracoccaceae bacterium]
MGATAMQGGVNFAIFSAHATRMVLCLFDDKGQETQIDLRERDGNIWHGFVEGVKEGQLYGYRAHGPYRPDEGHRFNANKLLLDPYARCLTGPVRWDERQSGFDPASELEDLSFDTRDSAPVVPRCIVDASSFDAPRRPATDLRDTVIYETHVKGMTARRNDVGTPGSYAALASDPILDHLTKLGVTAVELLPVHAFADDRYLVERGKPNFWGYQSIGFFAPDPRYSATGTLAEFRAMVDRFHAAGVEVILDVVYNHTGEGSELGPTLSFRGLDNASYYRLQPERRRYADDTGTGNSLNLEHPMVLRMVMDSLRYWSEVMGVDGFRFDLCTTLGRTSLGFEARAPFFDALRQDPVLARAKLIAEPWDVGYGGYQLGGFPHPFLEWNDRYRDGVRRFWRGDPGRVPDLSARLVGSAQEFDHSGRRATSSVNFLAAHDGLTLRDVVSYARKHNEANGEEGRDGHSNNYSANLGEEGETEAQSILANRAQRMRNMMATLLLSQGTPMIHGGDEMGMTKGGNNNTYNQDNETSWHDWDAADHEFTEFTRRLIAFRKDHPILRQKLFLHSRERLIDGVPDLFWRREDGAEMTGADWDDPERAFIAVEARTASGTPFYAAEEYAVFMVFNREGPKSVRLPEPPEGQIWCRRIDTTDVRSPALRIADTEFPVPANAVTVFVLEPAD